MLWVGFIATEMGMLLSMPLVALQDPMAQIIQKTWTRNLKAYMKKVHSILIDLSISADVSEARAIAEIAAEQRNIESWATAVNYLNSTQQGLAVAINLLWVFVPMAVLAINPEVSSYAEVGTLCFLSIMCLFFFGMALSAATKPNIAWNNQVSAMLYDARIQNINTKLIQNRFQPWLDSHEISATRAFGIKVTVRRLLQSVSIVSSIFTLVMYLILREQLRSIFTL